MTAPPACVCSVVIALAATAAAQPPPRLNDVQVVGSHNSYKQAIDAPLLKLLESLSPAARGLDYTHATFTEQLDLGVRALELDLYHDPEGGRYATPAGLKIVRGLGAEPAPYDAEAMRRPGFKVMHQADIDFRSTQPTLAGTLAELRRWSETNPGHVPVFVTMNLKTDTTPTPGAVKPLPFDAAALNALDAAIVDGLGADRLITPDLVRGDHPTLEAAVLAGGWPELDRVRGRFLWAIDEQGAKRAAYLKGRPSLRGRVMFTTPPPGADDAAVLVMNNPVRDEDRIRELVGRGYLVRTRADAETREARTGDTTRLEAALRSGAHIISTDYYRPDPRFGTGYRVTLEGGVYHRVREQRPATPAGVNETPTSQPAETTP